MTDLPALLERERAEFARRHPRSLALAAAARGPLLMGVPMPWMAKWAGGSPLFFAEAHGSRVVDVDGHAYVDVALGDTGAMAGHSPPAALAALHERAVVRGGVTTMMPTDDARAVGVELARRFGLPAWQFALSATDANRFALRLCRQIQRRPKVLVFGWSYHGSVDETIAAVGSDGRVGPKPGSVGAPVDPALTTVVVEFNDLEGVRRALERGDVACVLTEPALTNVGMVLPDPGFLGGLEEACRATATLLVYDETHTLSAGAGGCVARWGLRPDLVTLGKAFGAGVPIGAYGVSAEVRDRVEADPEGDYLDWGGVGGTLAGNALSLAVARATLAHVLTPAAFTRMEALATRYREGLEGILAAHGLPWSVVQLGGRAEFVPCAPAPRTGGEAAAAMDPVLDDAIHLALLNRGVLLTPFHNMALMGPDTSEADVETVLAALDEVLAAVARASPTAP